MVIERCTEGGAQVDVSMTHTTRDVCFQGVHRVEISDGVLAVVMEREIIVYPVESILDVRWKEDSTDV